MTLIFLLLSAVALIGAGVAVAISVIVIANKKKAERPLSVEEKIVMLNNQLSVGAITKEEYDKQRANLLNNI